MTPRILLVGDVDAISQAKTALLSDGSFQLKIVSGCREALNLLNTEVFDMILLDIEQGGEPCGLEMCRQLKANPALGWIPVMFTTRKVSKDTLEKIHAVGGDEFIASPFHPDELIVRTKVLVRKGLDERRLVERTRKLSEKIAERDDELDDLRRFAQDIVSSLSSALLVVDADETILFANAPFLEAVRAERRIVIGHKLSEFVDSSAASGAARSGLTQAIRGAIQTGHPSRLRRITGLLKSSPTRVSDITLTAIDYGGVRQVLLVSEDVTEQAVAEIDVGKERAKLTDMVNAMNASLCLIDRESNIHWQNRTFGLWFGDSFGQPGLQSFQQQLRGDQSWVEQVFQRGQVLTSNWSVFTSLGQRRHFSNIIARIKAPGESEASQALVLTQDVTEAETRVEQLSLLRELSQLLQGTLDAERLQHVILLCMTTGHALGFNRAFLFTRNRAENTLDAQMAVGPTSRENAFRSWASISAQGRTLHDMLASLDKLPPKESMVLYPMIRNMRFFMEDSAEIIVRTALEKKEQVVTDATKDPRVTQQFRNAFGSHEFVSVPLIVKGAVVGVILADNLYSGRAITDDHVKLLMLFASQAALAIENAETYLELQKSLNSLRTAQQEIVHTAKLATIGKMAAHVAHEIRNPLSTIGGFARAILKKPENVDRVIKNASIIAEESTRLENMLKDVMDFSRPSTPVLKQVDFNTFVASTYRMLSEQLSQRNILSSLDQDRSIPEIQMDENQIRQVLVNLIRNAADSMPHGGALMVKTGRDAEMVEVSVTDTGSGMSPAVLERLFDPFFTTKPDGTGLGLAVSKKIIEDHGGRIEVSSQVGKGTHFKVLLPTHPAMNGKNALKDAQISGLQGAVPAPLSVAMPLPLSAPLKISEKKD